MAAVSPFVLIHGTSRDLVPEIMRTGIEPRDTTRHNFRSLTHSKNAGIEAVYATMLGRGSWSSYAYVVFDAAGLTMDPDPELRLSRIGAVRVRERVEPERILAVFDETTLPMEWLYPEQ